MSPTICPPPRITSLSLGVPGREGLTKPKKNMGQSPNYFLYASPSSSKLEALAHIKNKPQYLRLIFFGL